MLTDKEMLEIAERYLTKLKSELELKLYDDYIKKEYGNIYYYNTKECFLGNPNKSLAGGGPFLVENTTGRVVSLGTLNLENTLKKYKNGSLEPSLDLYWYPAEDRYDYK
ncbi:hypothetical protein CXF68_04550 [Tenacibaculum sp. Bg11-29]|uniref:hypothetical protein n=1 Tax=Tenacibaculum sp. Bg11-29 TaxID=2058306 RepID=UPI000C33415C|nr:hypothetical protein [Tenacibaculum sp. Bg11-29]PKH50018.1 hypothetical protein CXF68_04550 [Tenacibaculum sp. Bg11-29]